MGTPEELFYFLSHLQHSYFEGGEGYRGSSQPNSSGPYASFCPHQGPE